MTGTVLERPHLELLQDLQAARGFSETSDVLRDWLKSRGYKAHIYGFAGSEADIRSGACFVAMTLPAELAAYYEETGGSSRDPIADGVLTLDRPTAMDYPALRRSMPGCRDYDWMAAALDMGFDFGVIVPFRRLHGGGSLNVFADGGSSGARRRLCTESGCHGLAAAAGLFHEVLHHRGLHNQGFALTDRELDALRFTAYGESASDMSDRLHVSRRAIEKRLANARSKLGAVNTANAVYRAAVYGLI